MKGSNQKTGKIWNSSQKMIAEIIMKNKSHFLPTLYPGLRSTAL